MEEVCRRRVAILGPFLGGRQKPRTYPNSRGPNWLSRHGPALGCWFWVEFRSGYIWHGGSLSPAAAARGGGPLGTLHHPSPSFIICSVFNDGHFDWCEVVPHYNFDLDKCYFISSLLIFPRYSKFGGSSTNSLLLKSETKLKILVDFNELIDY